MDLSTTNSEPQGANDPASNDHEDMQVDIPAPAEANYSEGAAPQLCASGAESREAQRLNRYGFETPFMLKQSTGQLLDALETLPKEETHAYYEAVKVAPTVVEAESDLAGFLRCENFSPLASAQRLASYWTHRRNIFVDRAFLPITDLSGSGAMDRQDIAALETACLAFLPNDAHKSLVLFQDASRGKLESQQPHQDISLERLKRCSFFMLSSAAALPEATGKGLIWISISSSTKHIMDTALMELYHDLVSVMPVEVKKIHLCFLVSAAERGQCTDSVLAKCEQARDRLRDILSVHVADSKEGLLDMLLKEGFVTSGLPSSVGGYGTYQGFSQWMERQTNHPDRPTNHPANHPVDQSIQAAHHNTPVATRAPTTPSGSLKSSATDEEEHRFLSSRQSSVELKRDDKRARKREWDAKYARDKRRREKEEREGLQLQFQNLMKLKNKLEQENKQLQESVRRATEAFRSRASATKVACVNAELSQVVPEAATLGAGRNSLHQHDSNMNVARSHPATASNNTIEPNAQALALLLQLLTSQPNQPARFSSSPPNKPQVVPDMFSGIFPPLDQAPVTASMARPSQPPQQQEPVNPTDTLVQELLRALQPPPPPPPPQAARAPQPSYGDSNSNNKSQAEQILQLLLAQQQQQQQIPKPGLLDLFPGLFKK